MKDTDFAPLILLILCLILFVYIKQLPTNKQKKEKSTTGHSRLMESSFRTDIEVNRILIDTLNRTRATWVTIWQIHNGTFSIAGVPFMKVSVTHEASSPNQYLFGKDYRDIPISLFISSATNFRDTYCIEADCEDERVNTAIRNAMCSIGIRKAYAFPIRSLSQNYIGMMTVSFREPTEMGHQIIDQLRIAAASIGVLLEELAKESNDLKQS